MFTTFRSIIRFPSCPLLCGIIFLGLLYVLFVLIWQLVSGTVLSWLFPILNFSNSLFYLCVCFWKDWYFPLFGYSLVGIILPNIRLELCVSDLCFTLFVYLLPSSSLLFLYCPLSSVCISFSSFRKTVPVICFKFLYVCIDPVSCFYISWPLFVSLYWCISDMHPFYSC